MVKKGKIISSCLKDLSMKIEFYYNKCVLSNILEKQDKLPPDKIVHHFNKFICSLQILLKGGI